MSVRVEHGDSRDVLGRFVAGEMARIECQYCGRDFLVHPSRVKHGRGKSCSPKCQYAAIKARSGPNISLACIGCGVSFKRYNSQIIGRTGGGKYCSRGCRDANRIREKHPQFIGRPVHHRGPNWHAQKRRARRRDNWICQHCREPGRDVHHMRPFRLFDDYRVANELSNLVTLCHPCHRKADAAFQAEEAGRGG